MTILQKTILATCLLVFPLTLWSEVSVVDGSDNFAMEEEQAWEEPADSSAYDRGRSYRAENKYDQKYGNQYAQNKYSRAEEESPLVKEDAYQDYRQPKNGVNDSAKLIDKIQSLSKEIQELRGQLEIQAHQLKSLQEQQIAFYKDLDSRLGSTPNKTAESKPLIAKPLEQKPAVSQNENKVMPKFVKRHASVPKPRIPVSRVNPADEQISYLAAYELIKNKQFGEALRAMQIFVQKYPAGGYTANAEYWLGELYLQNKEYAKSIEHFETVLEQFPYSNKAAASMLKVGYAYAASGDVVVAKKHLQEVIRIYPNTASANLASTKLVSLSSL